MDYYRKKQYLARVDKKDKIIGKIEKWEAHKKNILHRGYTCILTFEDKLILQHRKHLVFDKVFDLSFSSHQIYSKNKLQSDKSAILDGLKREWNLSQTDLKSGPGFLNKIYYQAKDAESEFNEHEIDYIYTVELKNLPKPNLNFSYGFKLVKKLKVESLTLQVNLAPWVKVILQEKLNL